MTALLVPTPPSDLQIDRRAFLGFGGAALAGLAVCCELKPFVPRPGCTTLLLANGRDDFSYGVPYQAQLRGVLAALHGYGLHVTYRQWPISRYGLSPAALRRLPEIAAIHLDKHFVVHSGSLPRAFGDVLRAWHGGTPERLVALHRHGLDLYAATPVELERLCLYL